MATKKKTKKKAPSLGSGGAGKAQRAITGRHARIAAALGETPKKKKAKKKKAKK